MSIHNFKKIFPIKKIKKVNNVSLKTFIDEQINLIRVYECTIEFKQKTASGKLFVLADHVDNIFGRDWIQALNINVHTINQSIKHEEINIQEAFKTIDLKSKIHLLIVIIIQRLY